jgi:GWxTD domain-containing protein
MTKSSLLALLVAATAAASLSAQAGIDQRAWQKWLDDVRPLMQAEEIKAAKSAPAAERQTVRDTFWRRRDPDPTLMENQMRIEIEARIQKADKRFRVGSKNWNDCGRTYLILGPPDRMKNVVGDQHFSSDDRMRQFADQEGRLAEIWQYRNNPRLPPSPEGFEFRFDPACQFVASPATERLLAAAVAGYVLRDR